MSDLTVTDQFCGAGGSSIGAEGVTGLRLQLAMNHWRLAIDTHQENFPHADHDCADISATDPRRYRPTDILLTSPECTNHSLAKGASRNRTDPSLFETSDEARDRIAAERSRATMFDVPRFAEHHRYRLIVVENVVEARQWVMWPAWWQAMELLGYEGRCVYLNSMFFPPTPQSRDRMYVVWWRKGQPAPDLDFRPTGWCPEHELVAAVQTWKRPDRPWGRYRQQYLYRCPECATPVEPAYTPAWTAIDWSDLGERIGDRDRPLAAATMARIRAGIARYGPSQAVVPVGGSTFERHPERAIRYRPVDGPLRTQTASERDALVSPFVAELRGGCDARSITDPLATVCASGGHHGLVVPPGWIVRNNSGDGAWPVTPVSEPIRTLTTKGHQSLLVPVGGSWQEDAAPTSGAMPTQTGTETFALLVPYYGTGVARDPETEPLGTLTSRDRFALLLDNRHSNVPKPVSGPIQTICTGGHLYLLVPTERGHDAAGKRARTVAEPLPTQTSRQTGAVVSGALDVDDCGFRMLQPAEIGAGMAFPSSYRVLGNKRERVKQYGNAVTPPVMRALLERCVGALEVAA